MVGEIVSGANAATSAIKKIDPVAQPPAVAWKRVANQKIEELVSASGGTPVNRVTEVQESTLYELRGSKLEVSSIGLSQSTHDVYV